MAYHIAGIDVHKKMLAVVVADVAVDGDYQFEPLKIGTGPAQLRARGQAASHPRSPYEQVECAEPEQSQEKHDLREKRDAVRRFDQVLEEDEPVEWPDEVFERAQISIWTPAADAA